MITFLRRKEDCLKKADKSSIGEWDEPIIELCKKINAQEKYYTLSSCSGRIVLIKNLDKKQAGMFSFRSHAKVKLNELKKEIEKASKTGEDFIFKQEPCILHVCCNGLEDAEKMLELARASGWKNSGIMSTRGRIVLELRSTEYLALPIIETGKLIVDDNFLKILLKESNKRLEKTWEKIKNLEKKL
jgi:tRNA wybutosine-synthesizing protein 3